MVHSPQNTSTALLDQLDAAGAAFGAELQAGKQPTVESFLNAFAEQDRATALRKLLNLELEHKRARGEETPLAWYLERFPSYSTVVQELFADTQVSRQVCDPTVQLAAGTLTTPPNTPSTASAVAVPLGRMLGNYELLAELGQGGMGTVYKARHVRMDRVVALKTLSTSLQQTDAVGRFQREVKALAKLSHPNIVHAHDADEADGVHFLVMEYVEGQDLANRVQNQGPLDDVTATDCIRQAAEGLRYAHERGIVHRDIKPSNLLWEKGGVVKVLDLGLATFDGASDTAPEGTDLTQAGSVMGTVDYMSPEQAVDSRRADARSDIYSLGCTWFFLLTGRPVFGGKTLMERLLAHRDQQLPALKELTPGVSRELESVWRKMVAKHPAERYQSMGDVLEAIAGLKLSREPAAAIPPRHGRRALLGGAVALAFVVLVVVLGIVALRVRTPSGTIIVEFDPEAAGAEVLVDDQKRITIVPGANEEPIEVAADGKTHTLKVIKGGFETFTETFTVKTGQAMPIRVRLEALPDKEPTVPAVPGPAETTIQEPEKLASSAPVPSVAEPVILSPAPTPAESQNSTKELGTWLPGPAENALPGLIARPRLLAQMGRWQMRPAWPKQVLWCTDWCSDGELIACGGEDGVIRLFDPELRLVRVIDTQAGPIRDVRFSPNGEWLLASQRGDGTVRLWSKTGSPGPVMKGHEGEVSGLTWSPDGRQFASAGNDGVRLWNLDGTPGPVLQGHTGNVHWVAWSPDGQQLASCCWEGDNTLQFWSREGQHLKTVEAGARPSLCVEWSPDGQRLSSGGFEGRVRIWSADGQLLQTIEAGEVVEQVSWSPDGAALAVAAGTLGIWKPDGASEIMLHPGDESTGNHFFAASWSPDGRQLVSVDFAGNLQIWDRRGNLIAEKTAPSPSTPSSERLSMRLVAWHPDGNQLAAAEGPRIRILGADAALGPILSGHQADVLCLAWSPDGQRLASGAQDGLVRLWQSDGSPDGLLKGHVGEVSALAWSPDGTQLLTGGPDGWLRLWQMQGPRRLLWSRHTAATVENIAWHPDGKLIATGGVGTDSLQLWATDGTLHNTILAPSGHVSSLAWSPDGQQLAAGTKGDGLTRIWDAAGNLQRTLPHHQGLQAFHWSRDGTRLTLASGHVLRSITPEGQELRAAVVAGGDCRTVDRHPESGKIVVYCADGSVQVWDEGLHGALWRAYLTPGADPLVFSAAGELLHGSPEQVEREFHFVRQTFAAEIPQPLETLSYSDFRKHMQAAEEFERQLDALEDPDRRAAAWALAVGGKVEIFAGGERGWVTSAAELPETAFLIKRVFLASLPTVDDAGLARLEGLTGLTNLDLQQTSLSGSGLAVLPSLPSLQAINLLNSGIPADGLRHLAGLQNLTWAGLYGTWPTDETLAILGELPRLSYLQLGAPHSDLNLSDEGLQKLAQSPALTSLLLESVRIREQGLANLMEAPHLTYLQLNVVTTIEPDGSTFPESPALRTFRLVGPGVTEALLEKLPSTISQLDLAFCDNVSDRCIPSLARARELGVLSIYTTKFTEAGLSQLPAFEYLHQLEIAGRQLSNTSAARLKELPNLQTLSIRSCTDEQLQHVAELSQLKRVDIFDSPDLTDAAVESLQAALPECEVQWHR